MQTTWLSFDPSSFENENDIDIDFILDKKQPDYDYKNENSPLAFIEKVKNLVG